MFPRRPLVLSAACTLVIGGVACGGFTGLGFTVQPATTSGGVAVDVYRMYATFNGAANQAHAVAGLDSEYPQVLDSGGSGFYQVTLFGFHQNGPVNSGAVAAHPDLALDSMLTIGVPQGYTGQFPATNFAQFNFAEFNTPGGDGFGDPTVTTTHGGWSQYGSEPVTFAVPYPPANAIPPEGDGFYCRLIVPDGATHAVLIGQFSVAAGETFSGDLGQLAVDPGGPFVTQEDPPGLNTVFSVPGCPVDLSGNCLADFSDILAIIGAWGPCGLGCREDLNGNGSVDFADILAVIEAWGPCP